MSQSRRITDGALLIAVYIVLLLIVMFVPFVILLGLFALPVPFIMYSARHDWKPALMMLFVAIIVSFIFATALSLPLTLLAGIGGVTIGAAIKHDISPYETWARGSVGFIIGLLLNLLFVQFILDVNLQAEIQTMVQESMQFTKTIMEQTGMSIINEEQVKLIEDQMNMFVDLLPSSIAIMGILIAFISQWLSYRVISRVDGRKLAFPPFRTLNLPTSIIWLYFLVLMVSFFSLDKGSSLYLVIINAMTILVVLIIIQGFSFVFFYAHYKKIHKSIPIVIVISSFILPFILLFFIRLIGIIDIGFSLKEKLANSQSSK